MPIIINEFELIPEPAQPVPANTPADQPPPLAQNTLPQDVDSVQRLHYQRAARVNAD